MDKKTTYEILVQELDKIPKAQIRSLSLEVLPRLMGSLDNQNSHCPKCRKLSSEGESFVRNIKNLFKDDIKAMRSFENWVEISQKHLKQEHHLRVKGRVTSSYTAIGMVIGVLVASVYVWLTGGHNYTGPVLLGWAIGMLGGFIAGKTHENKLHKENKLY